MPFRTIVALKKTCVLFVALLLLSATASAQNNLLQQGLGLLSHGCSKTGALSQGEMGDGLKEALQIAKTT